MDLRSRLRKMEAFRSRHAVREILICAAEHGSFPFGGVDGDVLRVAHEYRGDPVAGLAEDQRAWLKPGDRVTVMYERDLAGGSLQCGEYSMIWDELQLTWGDPDELEDAAQ